MLTFVAALLLGAATPKAPVCVTSSGQGAIGVLVVEKRDKKAAIPGVEIVATRESKAEAEEPLSRATSDVRGQACLAVPAGSYRVKASLAGYRTIRVVNLAVRASGTSSTVMRLEPQGGETIEINDNDPKCRPDPQHPGTFIIPNECLQKIPH